MSTLGPALLASSDDELRWFNEGYASASPTVLLDALIHEHHPGRTALVSSFGAEAVVTLKLVSQVAPDLPIIFLDTGKHFAETLAYVEELQGRLGLRDLRIVRPHYGDLAAQDPYGLLHARDADRCCQLRKTLPLQRALRSFDAWITGRKRTHGGSRSTLRLADRDGAGRLRVNPLCFWDAQAITDFVEEHGLPRHPLHAEGYDSVGCSPCTERSDDSTGPRGGRWAGQVKSECGIHLL